MQSNSVSPLHSDKVGSESSLVINLRGDTESKYISSPSSPGPLSVSSQRPTTTPTEIEMQSKQRTAGREKEDLGTDDKVSLSQGNTLDGTDNGRVDAHFKNTKSFCAGHVPLLYPVDENNIDSFINHSLPKATSCSVCARVTTCIATGLSVIGLAVIGGVMKIIKPDEIGLARGFSGDIFYLKPGCHVIGTFLREVKVFSQNENQIHHHPFHIIRILPGTYGLCTIDGFPYVMMPGRHLINNPLFEYIRAVQATSGHIRNGTISILIVPTGQVGIASVKGVGHILESGQHWINNPDFVFDRFVSASQEYIQAHAKHRILVPVGMIGRGWQGNESIFLNAEQTYYINDPVFRYTGSCSMLDEVIIHGSLKIITVNKGLVGVAFNNGELEILQPGRHVINRETWNFCSMLSTGQETIPIREITNLSSDNVGLCFEAALNIQVIDAAKAVTMLGRDLSTVDDTRVKGATEFSSKRFQNNVRDRARLALSIIIGNNPFTETFLATAATHTSNSKDDQQADTSFKGIIHDAFMAKFSKEMSELCGIRVIDMSIEDIQIVNTDLDEALAQAAVKATELEMARIDRDVLQQRAITAVNALKIRAEGEGHAKRVDAHATAKEIEILTKAECARIHDMDNALRNSSKASKICEMIAATSQTVDASQSAVVVANDITHLSQILSGRLKK